MCPPQRRMALWHPAEFPSARPLRRPLRVCAMTILLITLLAATVCAVVAYPFFRRSPMARLDDPADELAQSLRRARDRVYEEIRALQQEYFLKTLSEEEYREQLQAARLAAADLIRRQREVQETVVVVAQRVEDELRKAEASGADATSAEAPGGQST